MELTADQKQAFYDMRGRVVCAAIERDLEEFEKLGKIETEMVESALAAGVPVHAIADAQIFNK